MRKVRSFRWWLKMQEKSRSNSLSRSTEDQFFMYLRVNTLNKLVPYAAQRFIDNLPAIFAERLIMHYWKMPANAAIF